MLKLHNLIYKTIAKYRAYIKIAYVKYLFYSKLFIFHNEDYMENILLLKPMRVDCNLLLQYIIL